MVVVLWFFHINRTCKNQFYTVDLQLQTGFSRCYVVAHISDARARLGPSDLIPVVIILLDMHFKVDMEAMHTSNIYFICKCYVRIS